MPSLSLIVGDDAADRDFCSFVLAMVAAGRFCGGVMQLISHKAKGAGTLYTYETGLTLQTKADDGTGTLTLPAFDGVGSVSFPVRHSGDVLHALRMGEPIPEKCKAY